MTMNKQLKDYLVSSVYSVYLMIHPFPRPAEIRLTARLAELEFPVCCAMLVCSRLQAYAVHCF